MKKRAIVTYILAFALLFSACVYVPQGEGTSSPSTQGTESAPLHSDTSPSIGATPTTPVSGKYDLDYVGSGDYFYEDCTYVEVNLTINDQLVHGMALYSCEQGVKDLLIPEEVNGLPVVAIGVGYCIYDTSFGATPSIESISIPETVQYIGTHAFNGCTELSDLTLPTGIKYIGSWAFEDCPGLKELRITPDLKLDYQSLVRASGLRKVIIEEGVTFIPFFTGCSSLTEITLPSTITKLGTDGSDGNEPHFWGTQITFVEIPEGVTYLGWYVFQASNIESIILPSTLTETSTDTFDTDALEYVYFRGTEDQLLDEVRETIYAPIYFYSETEPTEEGNFWHYVDGKPVIW